jgi:hypothetical protein
MRVSSVVRCLVFGGQRAQMQAPGDCTLHCLNACDRVMIESGPSQDLGHGGELLRVQIDNSEIELHTAAPTGIPELQLQNCKMQW